MTAQRLDITIEQGATFTASFDIPGDIEGELTDMAAFLDIRLAPGAAAAVSLSTEDGTLTINADIRKVTARIGPLVTALLRPRCYFYDLKLLDTDDGVYRLDQGFAVVGTQVTIGGDAPAPSTATILLTQAGDKLVFQGGEYGEIGDTDQSAIASLFLQDGSGAIFQDGSIIELNSVESAGTTTLLFQDTSIYALQDGSTLQIV